MGRTEHTLEVQMIASITETDSPTQLLPPPATGAYQFIGLSNNGDTPVYLKFVPDADTALDTTNGIALPAGASLLVDQDASPILQNGIYGIAESGETVSVAVQAY